MLSKEQKLAFDNLKTRKDIVKNIEELQDTVLQLRSLFPKQINNQETLIAYEEYKYTYFPASLF